MASAAATETAIHIIENERTLESGAFTPSQMEQVVLPALANDKIRNTQAPAGSTFFTRQIAIIPDCAILGHVGALTRISDGALLGSGPGRPPNWNYAKPKRLKPRHLGANLVTSLLGTQQYYHFFEKLLPLLSYLDRHHSPDSPLTVLVSAKTPAFQQSVCKAVEAAYPGVTFVSLEGDERGEIERYLWICDQASNVEWLPVTPKAAGRLSALLRAHYGQPKPDGRDLLFFSRGNTPLRRLTNEDAIEAIAAQRGLRRFEAVGSNHAEQVSRFANADVIVAVHGAGLTNLLFARPGTIVIEIFPEDFVKTTYLWLSNRLNLRHFPLVGSRGNYDQAFHLDPSLFAAKLDEALSIRQDAPTAA
jgi:hypothetical protein